MGFNRLVEADLPAQLFVNAVCLARHWGWLASLRFPVRPWELRHRDPASKMETWYSKRRDRPPRDYAKVGSSPLQRAQIKVSDILADSCPHGCRRGLRGRPASHRSSRLANRKGIMIKASRVGHTSYDTP